MRMNIFLQIRVFSKILKTMNKNWLFQKIRNGGNIFRNFQIHGNGENIINPLLRHVVKWSETL